MTCRNAAGKRRRRPARAKRPAKRPIAWPARPGPALARAIQSILARRGSRRTSLADVRRALQKTPVTWSKEGELLFPQDRTAR
jgi:hypothetical protein